MERIEGLHREGRDIVAAMRVSHAMNDTKPLVREYDGWQAALRRAPGAPAAVLDEASAADIARIVGSWTKPPREVS